MDDTGNLQSAHQTSKLNVRVLNVEKDAERFCLRNGELPPASARWRCNLAALSQRRNLFFTAAAEQIHVWQPGGPFQTLGTKPKMVLTPVMKNRRAAGYIDPYCPHTINNILVDDLGRDEVLLLATDSGNVCGYHVETIFSVIEREDGSAGPLNVGVTQIEPFFVEWVGLSAWGLAVHKFARLIAVSSNNRRINVFAFALVQPGLNDNTAYEDLTEAVDGSSRSGQTWHSVSNRDQLTHLHSVQGHRTRSRNLRLEYSGHQNNIPSISFFNSDLDPNGNWMLSTDIDNKLLIWNIWDSLRPIKVCDLSLDNTPSSLLRFDNEIRGWTVLALDPRSFQAENSSHDAYGGKPKLWLKGDSMIFDTSALGRKVYDRCEEDALAAVSRTADTFLPDIFSSSSIQHSASSSGGDVRAVPNNADSAGNDTCVPHDAEMEEASESLSDPESAGDSIMRSDPVGIDTDNGAMESTSAANRIGSEVMNQSGRSTDGHASDREGSSRSVTEDASIPGPLLAIRQAVSDELHVASHRSRVVRSIDEIEESEGRNSQELGRDSDNEREEEHEGNESGVESHDSHDEMEEDENEYEETEAELSTDDEIDYSLWLPAADDLPRPFFPADIRPIRPIDVSDIDFSSLRNDQVVQAIHEHERQHGYSLDQLAIGSFGHQVTGSDHAYPRTATTGNSAQPPCTPSFNEFPILHFSETQISMLYCPHSKQPGIICKDPLNESYDWDATWALQAIDRFNMVKYVPEYGIVAAASQKGQVAILTLTETKWGAHPWAFRVDWILPFKNQEKKNDRPLVPLLGMAVSPMQGFELPPDVPHIPYGDVSNDGLSFHFRPLSDDDDEASDSLSGRKRDNAFPTADEASTSDTLTVPECHARASRAYRPDEDWRRWTTSRHYRLLLLYMDHSVLSYEFWCEIRKSGGIEDDQDGEHDALLI